MKRVTNINRIVIVITILLAATARSQNRPTGAENEMDKKYTPNSNSIFNSLNQKREVFGESGIYAKNIIAYAPTAILRQKVLFFYQRDLGSGICLILGGGKAFGQDVLQHLGIQLKTFYNVSQGLSGSQIISNSTYSDCGPYLYGGIRYYFSEKTFEDGYVEFSFRHERMEYVLDSYVNNWRVEGTRNATFKMNALSFGYGYTFMVGPKKNFCHELYMNFGVKQFTYSKFDVYDLKINNGATERVYLKSGGERTFIVYPAINMGYIFGFGF